MPSHGGIATSYAHIGPSQQEHLSVLPADIDLAGAEVALLSAIGGQTRLRANSPNSSSPRIPRDQQALSPSRSSTGTGRHVSGQMITSPKGMRSVE